MGQCIFEQYIVLLCTSTYMAIDLMYFREPSSAYQYVWIEEYAVGVTDCGHCTGSATQPNLLQQRKLLMYSIILQNTSLIFHSYQALASYTTVYIYIFIHTW